MAERFEMKSQVQFVPLKNFFFDANGKVEVVKALEEKGIVNYNDEGKVYAGSNKAMKWSDIDEVEVCFKDEVEDDKDKF